MESQSLHHQRHRSLDGDTVCLICLQLYSGNKNQSTDDNTTFILAHSQTIFDKVSKHLSAEIFANCFQWNFVKEGSSPICSSCLASVEKIYQINSRLEELQNVIQDLIDSFTCEVLACHQKLELWPNGEHAEEVEVDVDIDTKSDVDIDIKDEYFLYDEEGDCPNGGSTAAVNEGQVQKVTESSETSIIPLQSPVKVSNQFGPAFMGAEKENSTADVAIQYHNIFLKPLSIILTRIDLPIKSSGKLLHIPEKGERPKRKAAVAANANLKQYIAEGPREKISKTNITTSIDSEDDWKSDSENEESNSPGYGDDDDDYDDEETATDSYNKGQPKSKSSGSPAYEVAKRFSKELESHSLKSGHKNEKNYKCVKCPKMFYRNIDLKNHKKAAHQTKISAKCQDCPKAFRTEKLLRNHYYGCHKTKVKCRFCEKSFVRKLNLIHHTKIHYGITYRCKACPAQFKYRISLKLHRDSEHKGKKVQCKKCCKIFQKRINLTQHYACHLKSKIKKIYPCAACKKIHFAEKIWDNCTISHFRIGKLKGVCCAICTNVFKYAKELDKHSFETGHLNKKLFKCYICKRRFYRKKDVKDHKRDHFVKCNLCDQKNKNTNTDCKHFRCTNCKERFHRERQLEKHVKKCTTEKGSLKFRIKTAHSTRGTAKRSCRKIIVKSAATSQFKCNQCEKTFSTRYTLNQHFVKTHPDETPLYVGSMSAQCPICLHTFESQSHLENHTMTWHKNSSSKGRFECLFCVEIFYSEAKLKVHRKIHKGKVGKFSCKFCGKVYRRRASALLHMRQHLRPGLFKCTECDKTFSLNDQLKKHQLCHSEERPFPCSLCESKFKRKIQLERHLAVHAKKRELCDICGRDFPNRDTLRAHKRMHSGTMFACNLCDRKFYENKALKEHIKGFHDKQITCDVCGKNYAQYSALNNHKLSHTEFTISCKTCKKVFNSRNGLYSHVTKVHREKTVEIMENSVKCNTCGKLFPSKRSLKFHMQTHEKKYQCEFCPYLCSRSDYLKTHIHTQHTKERPFVCDKCGKTFARKNFLSEHIKRIHEKVIVLEKDWSDSDIQ